MLIYENTTYCQTVSCILVWEFGRFLFGSLADFYLGTWRKFIRRVGGFLFGELAGTVPLISAVSKSPFPRLREGSCGSG
jgi:hypothetical protein